MDNQGPNNYNYNNGPGNNGSGGNGNNGGNRSGGNGGRNNRGGQGIMAFVLLTLVGIVCVCTYIKQHIACQHTGKVIQ